MNIKELLEKIKFNDKGELDETLISEIEATIKESVDSKVNEKAQVIAEEISQTLVEKYKEELSEKYESKFDEYKDMITEKFSDFLDQVLDEELSIPDELKEYARKGKLYSDLIDQFKVRLGIDENVLAEETKDLIREARDEIVSLRDKLNELEKTNIDLKSDSKKLSAHLYAREKCDGLTESQKVRALKLLEGCTTQEDIDTKFNVINETLFSESDSKNTQINEEEAAKNQKSTQEEKLCVCPKCGRETTIQEGACELYNCPDCEDTKLTDKSECNDKKEPIKENKEEHVDGFKSLLEEYRKNFTSKSW